MPSSPAWTRYLYQRLTRSSLGDDADSIGEAAAAVAPRNFLCLLVARIGSGLGDRLANPKTTLAWVLQAVGAPALFAGVIVPLRESGSLLPQMFLAGFLQRRPIRKAVWIAGAIFQGLAIAGCGWAAWTLEGMPAGLAILGLVAIFSLARGFSSLASKDLLGKTIPKSRRGQLNGLIAAASGVAALLAGLGLLAGAGTPEASMGRYLAFLVGGGSLFLLAAALHGWVVEFPSESAGAGGEPPAIRHRLGWLVRDRDFRWFVLIRALAIGSGLSAPFIVALAHSRLGGGAEWLGVLIVADGLAAMVSAPVWGRFADLSSRTVLRLAMALTTALLAAVIVLSLASVPVAIDRVAFPALFFLLGVAHSGVRLGRKTYLVDLAEGDRRTDYVAVSNTVIGALLLVAGALTGALALLSLPLALGTFAACSATGAVLAAQLPEVSAR